MRSGADCGAGKVRPLEVACRRGGKTGSADIASKYKLNTAS